MTKATCRWCTKTFEPRRGGSAGRFCCARHRALFWTACRKWAERAVSLGLVSIADLKADPAACTLRQASTETARILKRRAVPKASVSEFEKLLAEVAKEGR